MRGVGLVSFVSSPIRVSCYVFVLFVFVRGVDLVSLSSSLGFVYVYVFALFIVVRGFRILGFWILGFEILGVGLGREAVVVVDERLDAPQRGVQWEGGAVDGGSII